MLGGDANDTAYIEEQKRFKEMERLIREGLYQIGDELGFQLLRLEMFTTLRVSGLRTSRPCV